ncbi:MAG: Bcr/CflA family efflux MFS transporter [Pseudomonadota bacterium]|nr:Bcr/CflA family efflux MFS transporter [Pseudomonadota bacterium]
MKNMIYAVFLAMFSIVIFLAMDMYLPALPAIAKELNLTNDMAQYTITIWFLGSSSLQLVLGPIADNYGRKNVFLFGILIFIASSSIIALTDNYKIILIARFFQGTSVCSTMVAGLSTIHHVFSGKVAVQVMSVLMTITILAPSLGPLLGAYIVKNYSWNMIFWLLSIAGIIGFFAHLIVMPNTKDPTADFNLLQILKAYLELLTNRDFMIFVGVNCLLTSAFFIWIVESPFIIIEALGLGELYYGYIQIPIFGAFIIGGQLTRYFVKFFPVKNIVIIGLCIALIGSSFFLAAASFELQTSYVISAMTMLAIGASMTFGPLNRYTIISSESPMGNKVALNSLSTSICGVLSSFFVSFINNMTFYNISVPIFCVTSFAVLLFACVKVPEID